MGGNGGWLLITLGEWILIAGLVTLILSAIVASQVAAIFLLVSSFFLVGCGLTAIYQDSRYFEIFSIFAIGIIGGIFALANNGFKSLTIFLITTFGFSIPISLSNIDDSCLAAGRSG